MGEKPEAEYLLTSREPQPLSAQGWLDYQRAYWGIENGLHQRLDVSANEDKSRVRHRNATWILGMFRRIAVSVFMHWRTRNSKFDQATFPDFHAEMALENQRRAFALVNAKKSRALNAS